jgi:hypothetical protein
VTLGAVLCCAVLCCAVHDGLDTSYLDLTWPLTPSPFSPPIPPLEHHIWQSRMFRKIKRGEFKFHSPMWDNVSSEAKVCLVCLSVCRSVRLLCLSIRCVSRFVGLDCRSAGLSVGLSSLYASRLSALTHTSTSLDACVSLHHRNIVITTISNPPPPRLFLSFARPSFSLITGPDQEAAGGGPQQPPHSTAGPPGG